MFSEVQGGAWESLGHLEGVLGAIWSPLGHLEGVLEASWTSWKRLGEVLGVSWARLGRYGEAQGHSRRRQDGAGSKHVGFLEVFEVPQEGWSIPGPGKGQRAGPSGGG